MLRLFYTIGSLDLVKIGVKSTATLLQLFARTIYPGKLWLTNYRLKCSCPIRLKELINILQVLHGRGHQGK